MVRAKRICGALPLRRAGGGAQSDARGVGNRGIAGNDAGAFGEYQWPMGGRLRDVCPCR